MPRTAILVVVLATLSMSQEAFADQDSQTSQNREKDAHELDCIFGKLSETEGNKSPPKREAWELIHRAVVLATGNNGVITDNTANDILDHLRDKPGAGGVYFVRILGKIRHLGKHEEELVKILCKLLDFDDDNTTQAAARSLGLIKYKKKDVQKIALESLNAYRPDPEQPIVATFDGAIHAIEPTDYYREWILASGAIIAAAFGLPIAILQLITYRKITKALKASENPPPTS